MTERSDAAADEMVKAFEQQYEAELPPRGATVERVTGRVVPVDETGKVLLMRGCEPAAPHVRFWFTIGGGLEPGETARQAAQRELAEEAGIRVAEDRLGDPVHEWVNEFTFAHRKVRQQEVVFAVAVRSSVTVTSAGWDAGEVLTTEQIAWVDPAVTDLAAQASGPAALAAQVRSALRSVRDPSRSDPPTTR
ncbi:MAG TPA: NUDIX domain-containing protein [Candidatus Avipropionibacterium avicola]|uniref:NUDIX domain-containing protein n=1 Tax=Candidatus Avipropionibacterium avicola TaxID=2840701 RepID=A0A9D1KMP8_9ACTN|nr:NUDIX domain-containing protein [Candidatus Avipropionibacterium avicola]